MDFAFKRIRQQKGFTLIELLVVIAILAVLAAIVVPRVVNNIGNARASADLANRAMLQSAVERFFIDHGTFPVETGGDATAGTGNVDTGTLTTERLISSGPTDPWNSGRKYTMTGGVVNALGAP
jgi:type II secretion system protein G